MEKSRINKLEHVPIGSAKRKQVMFELLNEDLDQAIEILRQMESANGTERWILLEENQISNKDIQKTVELCHLLCYYYERVKENG